MPTTMNRRTQVSSLLLTGMVFLSGIGQAMRQTEGDDTFDQQMADLAGRALSSSECEQRMQALTTLLQRAGYGAPRTLVYADGTVVARWYHAAHGTTALAFSGQKAEGNMFSAKSYAGSLRWNEFLGER